jgi:hypothetical protein
MRYLICKEGNEDVPGTIITRGAVWWDEDDSIPLTYERQHTPFGLVEDIRRVNDEVTGEFVFNRDLVTPDQEKKMMEIYGGAGFFIPVEYHVFKGITFLTRGQLREVFITWGVPWAPTWPNNPAGFPILPS